ncbi:MAG: PIN domain-containing protein [Planctomycetes bacterium]|nr:PIN domain-containing protein [Planctomycetota bacterium]
MLIAAFRGDESLSDAALAVLADPGRILISSEFVRLEVLPKPVAYGRQDECEFYDTFFAAAKRIVRASRPLVQEAQAEAELYGLSAMDALHVAAAKRARCEEFITVESSTKPLFRVRELTVVSLQPVGS